MKVLIRGAGDLATGIAVRLHRSGFSVLMTEIAVPTTVRRTVAFSRAVYECEAQVEDTNAVLCHSLSAIYQAQQNNLVAVAVDENCKIREEYQPDVLVDAILAKKNLGTALTDAFCVIGIGPGFYAGKDCHCVVETKRGHDLGRCIWKGTAFPNTGVPGKIEGYAAERLIRSSAAGCFQGSCSIGQSVESGQLVGYVGETPIFVKVGGVVRGLLQSGIEVAEGMKLGDVDPRGIVNYCFTISDKAAAVGGGVLEAILKRSKCRGSQLWMLS